MKIFIVQSHLGGGGAERVGVLLANGFSAREHQVIVATDLTTSGHYHPDATVKLINIISSYPNVIVKWLQAIKNLRKELKEEQPDVIIGIMQLCSIVSFLSSVGLSIPIIMTEHNAFERPKHSPLSFVEYVSKFYVNKLYKGVTVLTNADKGIIGNCLKKVYVMPNPLSLAPIQKISKRPKTILAIGRLDAWHVKGFDVLIRAWALVNGKLKIDNGQLSSKGESWKLQIAGTGSEESLNYLKQLCKDNGVEDSVEFLGFRKDVEKLYQESSIFVLSSRYEGFGLVLIEAMSQGCACVACDYKGRQSEIIAPLEKREQGSKFFLCDTTKASQRAERKVQSSNCKFEACDNGILCEPDDVESLAAGIQKMIEDDEYRESVRMNAVERSRNYSTENTMARWEKMLNQLVN